MIRCVAGIVVGVALSAAADGITWKKAVPVRDGFLQCSRAKTATSNLIAVDGGKEYDVSGTFMREGRIGLLYFCLAPYDADRRRIERFQVANLAGTESVLARPAAAGDSVILIEDGSKWQTAFDRNVRKPYVAFGADHSGLFRDLPNRTVSKLTRIHRTEDAGLWQVGLMTPCARDYPAGEKLRLHHGGGGLMNIRLVPENEMPMGQAKRLDATIAGERLSGAGESSGDGAFWRGAKYVQFYIMPATGELLFRDVKITEAGGAGDGE